MMRFWKTSHASNWEYTTLLAVFVVLCSFLGGTGAQGAIEACERTPTHPFYLIYQFLRMS